MKKDQFFQKHQNLNVQKEELERKYRVYLREQENMRMLSEALQSSSTSTSTGGGGSGSGGTNYSLEFVIDTTEGTSYNISFLSDGQPIEFTIYWGDGEVYQGSGVGGYYSEGHTYPVEGAQYVLGIVFDDPAKILEFTAADEDADAVSVTGLQNLVNLTDIDLDYSGYSSIDFSGLANLLSIDVSDCDIPGTNTSSLTQVNVSGCTSLESLRVDDSDFSAGFIDLTGLDSLIYFDADQSGITGSLDLSGLPALTGFDLNGNTGLTSVTISSSQQLGFSNSVYLYDCALTETAVDDILVALSGNGQTGGYVDLSGGTNATPSATGLAARAALEANNWTVTVN
jgi:hypothetical protein